MYQFIVAGSGSFYIGISYLELKKFLILMVKSETIFAITLGVQ